MIRIGTAGWTKLEQYSRQLNCAEINSTFYRSHMEKTYVRWAATVPAEFRFSVKVPKTITHDKRLVGVKTLFRAFLEETAVLGKKRGPLLVQLPPSFEYASKSARFFAMVRELYSGPMVVEPRHLSWLTPAVGKMLSRVSVSRVVADPALGPGPFAENRDDEEGAWSQNLLYLRLHGSPRMYYSRYGDDVLAAYASLMTKTKNAWCIFDNTAGGQALGNALTLKALCKS